MTDIASQAAPVPPDVSVVIPVCNEEDNVLPLAREIHAALTGRYTFETIFVDDGSTDGTAEAVRQARAQGMPEIRLLRHTTAVRAKLRRGDRRAPRRAADRSRPSTATARTIQPTSRT